MSKLFCYALLPVSALLTAISQILLKSAANDTHKNKLYEYLNVKVILAYALYFGILILNIFIYTKIDYRFGIVLNSLAIVFVVLFSAIILKEKITANRIVGNLLIIIGITVFSLF